MKICNPQNTARIHVFALLLIWCSLSCAYGQVPYADSVAQVLHRFENQVQRLESLPRTKSDIVFIGSSSIRGWKNLNEAFYPLPVVNYGFGGSTLVEGLFFAHRLIYKTPPAILVIYLGENDLTLEYASAEEVFTIFSTFSDSLNHYLPSIPKVFISVKPSLYSWIYWERQQQFNELAKTKIQSDSLYNWKYIDITRRMLGDDLKPLAHLFIRDGLHMNSNGYEQWTQELKPLLNRLHSQMRRGH